MKEGTKDIELSVYNSLRDIVIARRLFQPTKQSYGR